LLSLWLLLLMEEEEEEEEAKKKSQRRLSSRLKQPGQGTRMRRMRTRAAKSTQHNETNWSCHHCHWKTSSIHQTRKESHPHLPKLTVLASLFASANTQRRKMTMG